MSQPSGSSPSGPTPAEIVATIDLLGDDHAPIVQAARATLLRWGDLALAALSEGAEADSVRIRSRCRAVLRALEVRDCLQGFAALRLGRGGRGPAMPLLEGALLLSQMVRTFVPEAGELTALLRREANELRVESSGRSLPTCARLLAERLHGRLGFRGGDASVLDLDHVLVDRVLVRRVGIPVSLSLIYLLVARWAGFSAVGVAAALAGTALVCPAPVTLLAAAPVLAGWLWYVGPQLRPFMPAVEAVDIGEIVRALQPGLDYVPRAFHAESVYHASLLVHGAYDSFGGGHLIEGELGGRPVRLSKLRVCLREPEPPAPEPVPSLDDEPPPPPPPKPGIVLPRFKPIFSGLFYEITLAAPIDGHVVVIPRPRESEASARPRPPGEPVRMDDLAFDGVYQVFASDPALARTLITPARRTAMLTLVVGADGPIELAFVGDRAYVAVPRARVFLESVLVRSEHDPPARTLVSKDLEGILALPAKLDLVARPADAGPLWGLT